MSEISANGPPPIPPKPAMPTPPPIPPKPKPVEDTLTKLDSCFSGKNEPLPNAGQSTNFHKSTAAIEHQMGDKLAGQYRLPPEQVNKTVTEAKEGIQNPSIWHKAKKGLGKASDTASKLRSRASTLVSGESGKGYLDLVSGESEKGRLKSGALWRQVNKRASDIQEGGKDAFKSLRRRASTSPPALLNSMGWVQKKINPQKESAGAKRSEGAQTPKIGTNRGAVKQATEAVHKAVELLYSAKSPEDHKKAQQALSDAHSALKGMKDTELTSELRGTLAEAPSRAAAQSILSQGSPKEVIDKLLADTIDLRGNDNPDNISVLGNVLILKEGSLQVAKFDNSKSQIREMNDALKTLSRIAPELINGTDTPSDVQNLHARALRGIENQGNKSKLKSLKNSSTMLERPTYEAVTRKTNDPAVQGNQSMAKEITSHMKDYSVLLQSVRDIHLAKATESIIEKGGNFETDIPKHLLESDPHIQSGDGMMISLQSIDNNILQMNEICKSYNSWINKGCPGEFAKSKLYSMGTIALELKNSISYILSQAAKNDPTGLQDEIDKHFSANQSGADATPLDWDLIGGWASGLAAESETI